MNKLNLAAIALCTGITFACSPKASMVKGVICDATINTLTVVSEEGDTLSFSTLDAERIVTEVSCSMIRLSYIIAGNIRQG